MKRKALDVAAFLDRPSAIVGTTGAGKTFAAKGAVEHLLAAGSRVIIIDPTGVWYGLRAGRDGSVSGGFPVLIFGGENADIQITPDSGEHLAQALGERDVKNVLGRMRSMDIVHYPANGTVDLADWVRQSL